MTVVTSSFPGASFPPGTHVRFHAQRGKTFNGTVIGLNPKTALVATQETHWRVPYRLLTTTQADKQNAELTLAAIETLAEQLIKKHQKSGELAKGWRFGFDFAEKRVGACCYEHKIITLTLHFCLKATKAEIRETILHEIAHAIVGPKHGHDKKWQETARKIGSSAERCYTGRARAVPRWKGHCGCGNTWKRQRLWKGSSCPDCNAEITWTPVLGES